MSLKWRIALGYSALLIVAMTAMSGIIVWRFQQILYDQAETSVNATMRAIVQFAQQSDDAVLARGLVARHAAVSLQQQQSRDVELGRTASCRSTRATGYPLAKTANLGALTIPPNPKLSPRTTSRFGR